MGDINLTTRAFTLLCKLSEHGKLTPEEIHELLETQKEMASSELQSSLEKLSSRIDAQNDRIDVQLGAINSKYTVLIVVIAIIGAALTIALSI